jgi:uncharacterized membrane protein YhaH (DUF805 family)
MERRIFINYRRTISSQAAGRLSDRLLQHFGDKHLFLDVDGIEPGVDFVKTLDDQVAQCSAFIAVIGPGWADLKNAAGQRRLDQPNDHVRIEIESALKRDNVRVIPVLVDGASMPTEEELPDSIKPLTRRQAVTLSHYRFGAEVDEMARTLKDALGLRPKTTTSAYTFAAIETPTPPWIDYLFSFEGRISRKSYWLSILGVSVVATLVLGGLAVALGVFDPMSNQLLNIYNIATLPLYWPLLALYLKRLHDFGQGRGWLWATMILIVFIVGANFTGYEANFASYNFDPISLLTLVSGAIFIIVGCFKGTPGPNQYGPDPLANIARKSGT